MPAKTKPALLVLDLDGTLIDSRLDIAESLNHILIKYGLDPFSTKVIGEYVGTGIMPLIKERTAQKPKAFADEVLASFWDFYGKNSAVNTRPYPGVRETLEALKPLPMIVLSNKRYQFIDPILKALHLSEFIGESYGGDSFPQKKPDPTGLLQICARKNIQPSQALLVGDTMTDVELARAAGSPICIVTYGYGELDALKASKPTYIVDQFSDLLHLVG